MSETHGRSIVLLNRFYWPDVTATAQMLTDLAEDLAAAGWRVTVVAGRAVYDGGAVKRPARETRNGVEIHRVAGTAFGRSTTFGRVADYLTYFLASFWRLARLPRPDVIGAMTDPPFIVAVAVAIGKWRHARVVYWVQDLYPQIAERLGALRGDGLVYRVADGIARRLNAACDLVIVLGPRMREAVIAAGADAARTTVIHNWADAVAIQPRSRATNPFLREHALDGKFVVLHSGNAGRAHTLDAIIGAMSRLRDEDIVFLFVGGGSRLRQVRQAAERDNLVNVRFLDYVPREALELSLAAASVSLVTEAPEAIGMVVSSKTYGILASGRPVVFVGSERSDVAALVREADCGVVTPPESPDALVEALQMFRRRPDLTASMGHNARRAAETRYSREISTAKWGSQVTAIL
ncbi:MAG: glycosyl transferase group 1 [Gemmatimonadetes bacterium]|nr:glycosyl transferase group 1 [Gemmatimonadota bacterium]